MATSPLTGLGAGMPVLAAPMAGGVSTPELVVQAARAGGLGFLAAGYQTVESLAAQLAAVRDADALFGVNLFAPNPVPIAQEEFRRYAEAIADEGRDFELDLAHAPLVQDDDAWNEKADLLLSDPVPVVSFTFGIPPRPLVTALRRAGTIVAQTVTSAEEARLGEESGADLLVLQGPGAGGHSGTLTPSLPPSGIPLPALIREVTATVRTPLVAAGGVASAAHVGELLDAGAAAVAVGTLLMRAGESGASATHRAALADEAFGRTIVTRAFTGRPARALANDFVRRYDAIAPAGYPALHHLTAPLRRAAAAAGDPQRVHLWAGTGYRDATEEPVAVILARLAGGEE